MGIVISGLVKSFGNYAALRGVDLNIRAGEFLALLGPSGSGKTTLLRILSGLDAPDAGSLTIDGEDISQQRARDRQMGFVFQHYALFRHMTVAENIAFGLRVKPRGQRLPRAQIDQRVGELLRLVQLERLEARYPAQLSGGQRQRVALARALAIEPKMLLLDEPFGALDAKVRKELRRWLRHLHEEMHVTTIFVTHDQEEAMDVAGQLVVMNEGRVEQSGSADELYENPANEFVMSFVGEVNQLGDELVRPHDMEVVLDPDDKTQEGLVQRIVALGFEIRVEFVLGDGTEVWAQLTRSELQRLELREGQIAYLRPVQAKSFNGASASGADGASTPQRSKDGGDAEVSAAV